jgi:two-component system response regulator PilR (NtrC family)
VERELITEALNATRWNRTEAARRLGITFRALRYRLKKLNLD